jgi:hypothetical protein
VPIRNVETQSIVYRVVTLGLRTALILALFFAGWLVYTKLPHSEAGRANTASTETTLQIVLQAYPPGSTLDIPVELSPVDIVAVRNEYFTERRAGKSFDDFKKERMNGRAPIAARLDKQGQTTVVVTQGNWWIHAVLPGEENLEWRLPIDVVGRKQTVALTPQNAYTRTKSF